MTRQGNLLNNFVYTIMVLFMVCCAVGSGHAQHHLNAGAEGTEQGDQLNFANGENFITNSGFVSNLDLQERKEKEPRYIGDLPTITVLPATPGSGGPTPGHPAVDSFIEAKVLGVEGPEGGEWGFLESQQSEPAFTVETGKTGNTEKAPQFPLTQSRGGDPFGHIHGRRFMATKPGLYTVKLQLVDTSEAGEDGGPIHTPSDPFPIFFQAGLTIGSIQKEAEEVKVRFGSQNGEKYWLESTQNIVDQNSWEIITEPISGNDQIQTFVDSNPPEEKGKVFYRIRAEQE